VDIGQRDLAGLQGLAELRAVLSELRGPHARADHTARLRTRVQARRRSLPRLDACSCSPGESDGSTGHTAIT